jgi:hypothetical protein
MGFRCCKEDYWPRSNGKGCVPRFKRDKARETMWNYALIADKTHVNLMKLQMLLERHFSSLSTAACN